MVRTTTKFGTYNTIYREIPGTYNTVRINQGQNQRYFNKKVLTTYVCLIYRMEGLLEYTFLHIYFRFQAENQVKRI